MSYQEVVTIIGNQGEELSRTNVANIEAVAYSWKNANGSNMTALFQNDKLNTKAQFGLPVVDEPPPSKESGPEAEDNAKPQKTAGDEIREEAAKRRTEDAAKRAGDAAKAEETKRQEEAERQRMADEAKKAEEAKQFMDLKDKTGQFTTRAKLISAAGSKITLEKEDGTRITIEIDVLDEASQKAAAVISVACQFAVPVGRREYTDYIRTLDLSVTYCDELGIELVLGRIAGDQLLLAEVELDGENLFEICDEDSQGMYELYEALFKDGEFQPELSLDDPAEHILFLWRAVLHEKLRPYESAIVEIICNLFGRSCVVVMWREVTHLSDKELADLGFAKIAGTEFVFRHMSLQTNFANANPRGVDVLDLEASMEDEALVLSQWKEQ